MATTVHKDEWLKIEEDLLRHMYWEFLVGRWLREAPFSILSEPAVRDPMLFDTPTPEALEDFGWLKVPESPVSH